MKAIARAFLAGALLVAAVAISPRGVSASDCTNVLAISARGSGEGPQGRDVAQAGDEPLGRFGGEFMEQLGVLLEDRPGGRLSLRAEGLRYPAISVMDKSDLGKIAAAGVASGHVGASIGIFGANRLREYRSSVNTGVDLLEKRLTQAVSDCPSQQFVLVGYSQGADVVDSYMQRKMSPSIATKIAGVALFGNPQFNSDRTDTQRGGFDPRRHGLLGRYPDPPHGLAAKTISFCNGRDLVCQGIGFKLSCGKVGFIPYCYPAVDASAWIHRC